MFGRILIRKKKTIDEATRIKRRANADINKIRRQLEEINRLMDEGEYDDVYKKLGHLSYDIGAVRGDINKVIQLKSTFGKLSIYD